MESMKQARKNEAGGVLIIILVAVALFAALSYTVSSMMRSGSPDHISVEKSKLSGSQMLDFGRQVRRVIQDLRISNGCTTEEISFTSESGDDYEHTPAAADTCKVFHSDGGAISYLPPVKEWLAKISPAPALQGTWYFPANVCAEDVGSGAAGCGSDGTDNEDVIMILPYISEQICEQINKQLGLTAIPTETGDAWPSGGDAYVGSFANDTELNQGGRQQGCFQGSGSNTPPSGTYHFYQVLVPR